MAACFVFSMLIYLWFLFIVEHLNASLGDRLTKRIASGIAEHLCKYFVSLTYMFRTNMSDDPKHHWSELESGLSVNYMRRRIIR